MSNGNGQKRRKYRRLEKLFRARFRVKQYEGLEMPSAEWDIVPVRNISAGGLAFNYTKNLGFNSLLDFKIDISLFSAAINCVGKIIRVEEPQSHSMYRIATEFTEIDKQEKEMLNTTIEKLLA
jgi:hypothetical protein